MRHAELTQREAADLLGGGLGGLDEADQVAEVLPQGLVHIQAHAGCQLVLHMHRPCFNWL